MFCDHVCLVTMAVFLQNGHLGVGGLYERLFALLSQGAVCSRPSLDLPLCFIACTPFQCISLCPERIKKRHSDICYC